MRDGAFMDAVKKSKMINRALILSMLVWIPVGALKLHVRFIRVGGY